ncbi:response regulator transcription factor, partial [Exiguobacterium indicum]
MPTLLIVDDEADIRQLLRLYLTNEGYEILEAENGEEALATLATRPVDAMLLDVMMPVRDG